MKAFHKWYNIETAKDIRSVLKDLSGGTIREMTEAKMDKHLWYENQYVRTMRITET